MRRLLIFILCLCLVFTTPITIFAQETTDSSWIQDEQIHSEPFIVPDLVGTSLSIGIGTYGYGERTVVGDIFTSNKVVYVYPVDQPPLGFEGTADAYASFFYVDGSSVKFSISIAGEVFSFTAETGYYSASGGAYSARIPTSSGKYRLKFKKDYIIRTVRYDVYSPGNIYEYSFYTHDPQYSLSHSWVKVG